MGLLSALLCVSTYTLHSQKPEFIYHGSQFLCESLVRHFKILKTHRWSVTRLVPRLESVADLIPADISTTEFVFLSYTMSIYLGKIRLPESSSSLHDRTRLGREWLVCEILHHTV